MVHGDEMDDGVFDDEDEDGPMVDDYHFVNRSELDGSQVFEISRIVRSAAEEIPALHRRFAQYEVPIPRRRP